jgi:hypothetical protein
MEILTFLLDIIKLLITYSLGVLTLSVAFIDKMNLNFNDKIIKTTIVFLWVSLVSTILLGFISSIFIYADVSSSICVELTRSNKTKISFSLTFFFFLFSIYSLIKIGFLCIKNNQIQNEN